MSPERSIKKEKINKQESVNVPELRFPEFTEEWSTYKLGDICKFSKGKGISKKDITEEGTPCIRYGELYTQYNELITETVSKTQLPLNDLVLSEENDIIIPSTGETAIDISQASCIKKENIAIGGDINILKTKEDGVFLSYYLNYIKTDIAKMAQGISVIHLYADQLKKLTVNIPSLEEQRKISNLLLSINKKIDSMEKNHQYFQEFKKYLLQNIFAQKLRFENHLDKWETYKLKELCDIVKGKQLNKDNMIDNGTYYVLNGGINPSGFTNDWNTPENTISISEGGNSCGYVNFNTKKFWSGGHCYTLDLSSNSNLNVYFLYSYLKSIESGIMRLRVGSGLPNIQKRDIESIRIKIPSNIEEQNKIANLLFSTDQKIKLVTDQLSYMEDFKKGLLQSLFV